MSYLKYCNLIEEIRATGRVMIDTGLMKVVSKQGVGMCVIEKKDGVEDCVKLRLF